MFFEWVMFLEGVLCVGCVMSVGYILFGVGDGMNVGYVVF